MSKRRFGRALLATTCFCLLMGAKGYEAQELGNRILPPLDTAALASSVRVKKGDTVLQQQIVKAATAFLGQKITLSISGDKVTIEADEPLEPVALGGSAAVGLPSGTSVLCASSKESEFEFANKAFAESLLFGVFKNAPRNAMLSRVCLIDSDGDSQVDHAIMAGANRDADLIPLPIEPTRYSMRTNIPFPEESSVSIKLAQARSKGFTLEMSVVVNGEVFRLAEPRIKIKAADLPKTVEIEGARIEISSYDPASRSATLKIDEPFPEGAYLFEERPQLIYVFIPGT
ncbi:hypothetical protein ACSMXM_15295 [Pacificimonas sp. ICDLI1SI03]